MFQPQQNLGLVRDMLLLVRDFDKQLASLSLSELKTGLSQYSSKDVDECGQYLLLSNMVEGKKVHIADGNGSGYFTTSSLSRLTQTGNQFLSLILSK